MDEKFGSEYFWGGLGTVIYTVLTIVAFSLIGVGAGSIAVVAVVVFFAGFYSWVLNTYEESPLAKATSAIMLIGIPVLLFILYVTEKDLSSYAQTINSATGVAIVAIVMFAISFVLSIVFRKTDKIEDFRHFFVIVRAVQIVAACIVLAVANKEIFADLFIWLLIAIFAGRALLSMRAVNRFDLYDEDDATAYCRKCIRGVLMDGMLFTVGVFMVTAIFAAIALIVVMIIGEIILIIVGGIAAGLS